MRSVVAKLVSGREYTGRITIADFNQALEQTGDRRRAAWQGGLEDLVAAIGDFTVAKAMPVAGAAASIERAALALQGKVLSAAIARRPGKLDKKALANELTGEEKSPSEAGRWLTSHFAERIKVFGVEDQLDPPLQRLRRNLAPNSQRDLENLRIKAGQTEV